MSGAQRTLTRAEARRFDRLAHEEYGVPGLLLMEAASEAASEALKVGCLRGPVGVLCGRGGNGGDGYGVARHLHCAGHEVVIFAPDRPRPSATAPRIMRALAQAYGVPIVDGEALPGAYRRSGFRRPGLWVDALLGTGFPGGTLRSPTGAWIQMLVDCQQPVVSLDLPSGFDADRGPVGELCVRADRTLTFVAPKAGFAALGARQWLGHVEVLGLGTPAALSARFWGAEPEGPKAC